MLLSNKDYENLLNFSYEIGNNFMNFYEDILELISKYFNYANLAFFPESINISSDDDINNVYLTNFYSINLENKFIREFKEYYYKVSIFQPPNLPKKLLSSTIISIDDIMPYSKFTKTENSQYLNKYNFHYRININLYSETTKLGTLCIFKSKEEGNFSKRDFRILEILSSILAPQYKNFLTLSNLIFKQNLLEKCYDSYPDGIIVWDSKQNILEANNNAKDFCCELAENLNPPKDFIYGNLIKTNQDLSPLHKTIRFLSWNLVQNTNNEPVTITVNNHIYTIKTSIIITLDIEGNMYTTYFTCITKAINNETCSLNKIKKHYNLTYRELEIIKLIKKGYSNKKISDALYLSNNTVKTHITNIFKKTNVNNRASLLNKVNFNA